MKAVMWGNRRSDDLAGRLRQAQNRTRLMLLLQAILWSALAAGSIYVVLSLVESLQPTLMFPVEVWTALMFTIAFLISASVALMQTPGLPELARRADRQFALQERISTALECTRTLAYEDARGKVTSALLEDAARHASAIDPRSLARIRFPRVGWLVIIFAALGVFIHFGVLQRSSTQPSVNAEMVTPLSAEEQSRTIANLRRAVELLGGEAEQRKDPYLQALAQSFDDLSRRVETGALSRAETQHELDRLLEHVGRAYEGEASPLSGTLAARQTSSNDASQTQSNVSPETQNLQAGEEDSRGGSQRPGVDTSANLENLLDELAQVEAKLQQVKADREANSGRLTTVDYQEFGPYITSEALERLKREREMREEQQARAGRPIGAAQEANKGPGDLAGEGLQPLAGEGASTVFEDNKSPLEQVLLPDRQAPSGERIQLELPPETHLSAVPDGQRPSGVAWGVGQETEVRRDQLGPRDRVIASRYFYKGEAAKLAAP